MRQTVGILGTPVDVLDTDGVLDRLEQFIQERRFHQVATANTDFLINALEDPELRYILRQADLVVPDGMPLIWASRIMGSPLPERVTGADLVPQLAALSAKKGYRIFMLGGRADVAARARQRLEANYPGIRIVGCLSPPVAQLIDMDHQGLLAEIRSACPDVLLVAFGNPKQEKWIHMNRLGLADVPICIGVGGTFDFIAGQLARAPRWMQRCGLEWVYRLMQEPGRLWGRYSRDLARFSHFLFRQWVLMRQQSFVGAGEVHSAAAGRFTILSIIGDLNSETVPKVQDTVDEAIDAHMDLILDLQRVSAIDGEGLGMLINLSKRAEARDVQIRLACVPPFLVRILEESLLLDGPYRITPSLARAFTMSRQEALSWHVRSSADTAVVTVRGAANPHAVSRLELHCASLLEGGRRVDLDLRKVSYVDVNLLSTLCRLAGNKSVASSVRVVPGNEIRAILSREKAEGKFTLLSPTGPLEDTIENAQELLELREIRTAEPSSIRRSP